MAEGPELPLDPALLARLDQDRAEVVEFARTVATYHRALVDEKLPAKVAAELAYAFADSHWSAHYGLSERPSENT